jgi:parvulin-like peptidyl-prolyl isomerase
MIALTVIWKQMLCTTLFGFIILAFSACGSQTPSPTGQTQAVTPVIPTATTEESEPTSTPPPLAAIVNGEGIPLQQYLAEVDRYYQATGTQLATEDVGKIVIADLVNQVLLAQAAVENGYIVEDEQLEQRINSLMADVGEQQLLEWMVKYGYDEQSFRTDLERSIASSWMRDQLLAGFPDKVEQVHARQILLYNADEASDVLARIRAGTDFLTLASEYDPLGAGDLGWFPRGYLTDVKLEEAAFSLQPGEVSDVIATDKGYHILLIVEREPVRDLDPNARIVLREQAIRAWLDERRMDSEIVILTQ